MDSRALWGTAHRYKQYLRTQCFCFFPQPAGSQHQGLHRGDVHTAATVVLCHSISKLILHQIWKSTLVGHSPAGEKSRKVRGLVRWSLPGCKKAKLVKIRLDSQTLGQSQELKEIHLGSDKRNLWKNKELLVKRITGACFLSRGLRHTKQHRGVLGEEIPSVLAQNCSQQALCRRTLACPPDTRGS